jgi:cyclopropane fatty-acyl-phospholipid synthase-like methyltransferase
LNCVEIGFGNGHFAAWCNNQNITYSGLEIIEQLVTEGKSLGFNVDMSAGNLQLNANSIDLVVAFDVFEHFTWSELKEQLDMIHRWLKPGGLLVFRVPSGDSPFSRALQHGDITHKITIGSSLTKQLAVEHDYKIQTIISHLHFQFFVAALALHFAGLAFELDRR